MSKWTDEVLDKLLDKDSLENAYKEWLGKRLSNESGSDTTVDQLMKEAIATACRLAILRYPNRVQHDELRQIFFVSAKGPKQLTTAITRVNLTLQSTFGFELSRIEPTNSNKGVVYILHPLTNYLTKIARLAYSATPNISQSEDMVVISTLLAVWFDNRQPVLTLGWVRNSLERLNLTKFTPNEAYTEEQRLETLFKLTPQSPKSKYISPVLELTLAKLVEYRVIELEHPQVHFSQMRRLNESQILVKPGPNFSKSPIRSVGLTLEQLDNENES